MSNQRHILILTADAGFGHRSAAQAIAAALQESHGGDAIVEVVNLLDDKNTPALLRDSQSEYDKTVRGIPDLYRFGYEVSDKSLPTTVIESTLTLMLLEAVQHLLESKQHDVIVTTYPLYLAPLSAAFTLSGHRIPLITVVTDLTAVHRLWFNAVSDVCVVPTQATRDLALKEGLPAEKVEIIGIPVHPAFAQPNRGRTALRAELNWSPDLTTILVVGSKRVEHLPDVLRVLNHSGLPLQLAVVAGGDDDLYRQLRNTEWHAVTHVYDYVDNMPTLMHAADCIVSKAGGLIVSEALACGRPILLVDVIQGQETGNADYILQNGAGELAHDPVEALEILYHWLSDQGKLLTTRAECARSLGRPRAAHDIADIVWSAMDLHRSAPST